MAIPERETARSLAAFELYLDLPLPRNLRDLQGATPKSGRNTKGKPLTLGVVKRWSAAFKWRDRAEAYDQQLAAAKRQKIADLVVDQTERRLRSRLQDADLQRAIGLGYLTDGNKPKPLQKMDPRLASIASQFLVHAAESERADLGSPLDVIGGSSSQPSVIQVAPADVIAELRGLVDKIQFPNAREVLPPAEKQLPAPAADSPALDIIDGVLVDTP